MTPVAVVTTPSTEVQAKAGAYLLEGRVRVAYANDDTFTAFVRGSARRPYCVGYTFRVWACTCRAGQQGRVCAHQLACQAVWAPAEPTVQERAESAERGRRLIERIGVGT